LQERGDHRWEQTGAEVTPHVSQST